MLFIVTVEWSIKTEDGSKCVPYKAMLFVPLPLVLSSTGTTGVYLLFVCSDAPPTRGWFWPLACAYSPAPYWYKYFVCLTWSRFNHRLWTSRQKMVVSVQLHTPSLRPYIPSMYIQCPHSLSCIVQCILGLDSACCPTPWSHPQTATPTAASASILQAVPFY